MKNKINIDELFFKFNNNTPGCSVCLAENGKIIKEFCIGLADIAKNKKITPKTSFRLASITKTFTAMAIMILKEQGLLGFDDRIIKFIPTLPVWGESITLRQILCHTSGMPDHEIPLYKQLKVGQEPTIYDALTVLTRQPNTIIKPGSKYLYSDTGYVVLALIIEKVAGQKYADFLSQNIFLPSGLKNTFVMDETKPFIKNTALGYKLIKNQYELFDYDPLNYVVGDEGIYSTPSDLIRFLKTWYKKILVNTETLKEAFTLQKLNDGNFGRCGFGWFIDERRKIVFHDGFWVGFNNIILTNIKADKTVVMLSNTTNFDSERKRVGIALKLLNAI